MADQTTPGPTARKDAGVEEAERLGRLVYEKTSKPNEKLTGEPARKLKTVQQALAEEEDASASELQSLRLKEAKAKREAEIAKAEKERRELTRGGEDGDRPDKKCYSILSTGEVIEDEEGDYNTMAQARIAVDMKRRWVIVDGKPIETFEAAPGEGYKTFLQAL